GNPRRGRPRSQIAPFRFPGARPCICTRSFERWSASLSRPYDRTAAPLPLQRSRTGNQRRLNAISTHGVVPCPHISDMMETAFLSHHPRVALGRPAGDLTSGAAVGDRPRDAGLRVLIADDEPPARHKLRKYLAAERDVVAVDECSDGAGALEVARRAPPDLLLLDVQLPVLDGLEVLRRLGRERRSEVLFVSAHEEYAIRAFEVDALDYLVKPFDHARFRAALDRVRRRLAASSSVGARSAFDGAVRRPGDPRRLVVRSRGRILSLGLDEIES